MSEDLVGAATAFILMGIWCFVTSGGLALIPWPGL